MIFLFSSLTFLVSTCVFEMAVVKKVLVILSFVTFLTVGFYTLSFQKTSLTIVNNGLNGGRITYTKPRNFKGTRLDNAVAEGRIESLFENTEELQKLGDIVHRRLDYIQNPSSCGTRRKVRCRMWNCGLGCTINTVSICLMLGYALNRTVVVTDPPLPNIIKPISLTCNDLKGRSYGLYDKGFESKQVIEYYIHRNKAPSAAHPPALPDDLLEEIHRYHDNPFLWWAGQIASYLLRPTNATVNYMTSRIDLDQFKHPTVGVHIRRTDKKGEAKYQPVDDYMTHVDTWFDTRPYYPRRIYLATDAPDVVSEVRNKYPQYIVMNDLDATVKNTENKERKQQSALLGIYKDVYMLSKCDFIVCTLSSNVCRLAYQLMQAERGNVSQNVVKSLDKDWYFNGIDWTIGLKPALGAKMPVYPIN